MIVIGKFKENYQDDNLPSIFSAIRETQPKEKPQVLEYLKAGKISAVAPGYLYDQIGNKTPIKALSYNDGVYAWRSDVIYYYEHYNIDLPDEFIEYVLKKKGSLV